MNNPGVKIHNALNIELSANIINFILFTVNLQNSKVSQRNVLGEKPQKFRYCYNFLWVNVNNIGPRLQLIFLNSVF
jgi:hypothetical protein